jgi:hypothetical protein
VSWRFLFEVAAGRSFISLKNRKIKAFSVKASLNRYSFSQAALEKL